MDLRYIGKPILVVRHLMILPTNTILFIGYGLSAVLAVLGFMKVLRNDKLIIKLAVVALLIAFLGFIIRSEDSEMGIGFAPGVLATPLVHILSYALLRFLYKALYKVEPTYNRMSWYDEEEGRRQNWMDVSVHVVPMLIAFAFPLFFM